MRADEAHLETTDDLGKETRVLDLLEHRDSSNGFHQVVRDRRLVARRHRRLPAVLELPQHKLELVERARVLRVRGQRLRHRVQLRLPPLQNPARGDFMGEEGRPMEG